MHGWFKNSSFGTSLGVQWLRLHASTAGGVGLIPGRGTKIPHVAKHSQNKNNNNFKILPSLLVWCVPVVTTILPDPSLQHHWPTPTRPPSHLEDRRMARDRTKGQGSQSETMFGWMLTKSPALGESVCLFQLSPESMPSQRRETWVPQLWNQDLTCHPTCPANLLWVM